MRKKAIKNLIGKYFGKLLVLEKSKDEKGRTIWICQCKCGNRTKIINHRLISGITKSCGCLRVEYGKNKLNDISGQKFGQLTIIKRYGTHTTVGGNTKTLWLCKCDCGTNIISTYEKIKYGKRISCAACSKLRKPNYRTGSSCTHWKGFGGILGTVWKGIRNNAKVRGCQFEIDIEYCWNLFNKQNGRCALSGIEIYLPQTFLEFKAKKGTASLDRIDSLKGYTKENVQWIHKDINIMKQDFDQNHFIQMCKEISKHNQFSLLS